MPGRRLFEQLRLAFIQANGRLILGSRVVDGALEQGRVTQIRFETSNRLRTIRAKHYILATGGIFGGGIQTDLEGQVWEPIFGLPVVADSNRHAWFAKRFISPSGQPVTNYGVKVNQNLNPLGPNQEPVADNLFIAGATIADADWTQGRTGDGVALASAATIVNQINEG